MSYNGSGTFQINTSGQPVVTGTSISSTVFNALTADLATGLSTAITKDGQTTTTARIPFALGINSTLVTDATNTTSGSIITAGGVGIAKALYVGTTANVAGAVTLQNALSVTGVTTVQAGTAALPAITTTGDTNTGIFFPAADTIAFAEGGAEVARFDSAGNFGVNQTSPSFKIDAVGSTTNGSGIVTTLRLKNGGTTQNDGTKILFTAGSSTDGAGIGSGGQAPDSADLRFYAGGNTQAMTLDASGQLGIGTSSPDAKVHSAISSTTLSSIIASNANDYDQFQIRQPTRGGNFGWSCSGAGSENYVVIDRQRSNQVLEIHGTTNHIWNISNAEVARINSSGQLCVGATVTAASAKIGITTTSTSVALGMYTTGTGGTSGYIIRSGDDSLFRFQVFTNGDVQNTNNSYGAISDAKLKENIVDASPKLADLMQVKVRNYNLKADPNQKQIGVIAQELETVFPSMIAVSKDTDKEGHDLGTTSKSVKYSVFVPMLIKAIQEQQAIITTLTARITALESA